MHFRSRCCLAFLGVRRGYTIGEVLLSNAEGEASALVIIGQLAELWVLLRESKEPVFETGVVSPDRSPLVSLIEIYFGRLMRFFNACNHISTSLNYSADTNARKGQRQGFCFHLYRLNFGWAM